MTLCCTVVQWRCMQLNQERMLYTYLDDAVLRLIRFLGFSCDAQYASNHTCVIGQIVVSDMVGQVLCTQERCTL